jgi:hypothetical protein
VLGTPPALILSQDQTLMLKVLSAQGLVAAARRKSRLAKRTLCGHLQQKACGSFVCVLYQRSPHQ